MTEDSDKTADAASTDAILRQGCEGQPSEASAKGGAELDVVTLAPPAPEWTARLQGLYKLWDAAHAEGVWARDLAWRLSVEPATSKAHDRFYAIPYGQQVAAALEVSRSEGFTGLGLVHRVFTHPTMRRKGLARKLIDAAKRDFRASGGRMLVLIAPGAGPVRAFYDRVGFREVVRAADGEALLGWAARGRHVREALLRFEKHAVVRRRPVEAGDWAALAVWSSLPGGLAGERPATLADSEWIEVFEALRAEEPPFSLEVGISRHGHVVDARATGEAPEWLARLASVDDRPRGGDSGNTSCPTA